MKTRKDCGNVYYGFAVIPLNSRYRLSFIGKWFADKYIIFLFGIKELLVLLAKQASKQARTYMVIFFLHSRSPQQPIFRKCLRKMSVWRTQTCVLCSVSPSTCCFNHLFTWSHETYSILSSIVVRIGPQKWRFCMAFICL